MGAKDRQTEKGCLVCRINFYRGGLLHCPSGGLGRWGGGGGGRAGASGGGGRGEGGAVGGGGWRDAV